MRFKDDFQVQCKVRLAIDLELRDSRDGLYTWRGGALFRDFTKLVVVKELILSF